MNGKPPSGDLTRTGLRTEYESLVFKNESDGAPIARHQDAVHPRRHRIINVDVYLDSSRQAMVPCECYLGRSTRRTTSA